MTAPVACGSSEVPDAPWQTLDGHGPTESLVAHKLAHSSERTEEGTASSDASGGGGSSSAGGSSSVADLTGLPTLSASVIATSNTLEDEPWLPVRNIITLFRIRVSTGDKEWELLRRYSDFHELDAQLRAADASAVPAFPPKLLLNGDASIAERFLELDVYLRGLLAAPTLQRHTRLLDFLGVEKHCVRYGVRRYEYDSAHSEGNRYIRDNDL